jgi:adhesin/invasin
MRVSSSIARRAGSLFGSLLLTVALPTACGGDSPTDPGGGDPPPVAIAATGGTPQSKVAGSASDAMTVKVTSNGAPVANATVTWTTTGGELQASTTTTNADGVASNTLSTVGSAAGTVTVTAKSGTASTSFAITVVLAAGEPVRLDYGPDFVIVEPATTSTALIAVLRDANNLQVTTGTVTYVSRTPAVATVNAIGQVTAVAAGQSVIVATTTSGATTFTDSLVAIVGAAGGPVVMADLSRMDLRTDTTFTVAVVANMRASSVKIASGKVTLTWDPAVLTYVSDADGASAVGATVNTTGASSGSLAMAFASSGGWSGRIELRKVTFKASATAGRKGALTATANQMFGTTGFANLLARTVSTAAPLFTR